MGVGVGSELEVRHRRRGSVRVDITARVRARVRVRGRARGGRGSPPSTPVLLGHGDGLAASFSAWGDLGRYSGDMGEMYFNTQHSTGPATVNVNLLAEFIAGRDLIINAKCTEGSG